MASKKINTWVKPNVGAPDPMGALHIKSIKLPEGYRARCDIHDVNFKTLDDLIVHNNKLHNYLNARKK